MIQLPLPTYQQSSSSQQGLDSTHSQCTQLSFPSLEPDLGHSCRMLLNHLLCQCSLSLIHFVGYKENHSQLGESGIKICLISFVTWPPADQQHTVYVFLNVTFYNLHNIAEVPGLHLWVKSWHHGRVILLILKYKYRYLQIILDVWQDQNCDCQLHTLEAHLLGNRFYSLGSYFCGLLDHTMLVANQEPSLNRRNVHMPKLTEGVGCSSNGTILPTPVSGWDEDGEGSAWAHITGVLSHSKHCTGTTTNDCDCHLLYTRCWGHIDIITINIKQLKVRWSYPASCDSNTSSTRDSFNLVHSNIQWSSWFICHEKVMWQQLIYWLLSQILFHSCGENNVLLTL